MKALVSNRGIITRLINVSRSKAIGGQGGRVQDDVPVPKISPDEILVKVRAVALNPTDFKHLDSISPPHSIIGCDYAGVVHQVGSAVKGKWNIGDRVAGAVHGGLFPDKGAFAEYLKTDADLAWKVPDGVSDADATTYGVSAVTAVLALNGRHGLPLVSTTPATPSSEAVFIYAGATSAGLYHIEVAKAAGYTVVTTASPRSFDLVRKYGADSVFDYRSPTVVADVIREYPRLTKAVDCFSEGNSTSICAEVLKPSGGKVVTLLPNGKSSISGVSYDLIMAYTAFGHPFQWLPPIGPKFEARPEDRAAIARFYENLPQLISILKPIPTIEMNDGFDGILEGLDKLRQGQVAGGKQVVKFAASFVYGLATASSGSSEGGKKAHDRDDEDVTTRSKVEEKWAIIDRQDRAAVKQDDERNGEDVPSLSDEQEGEEASNGLRSG